MTWKVTSKQTEDEWLDDYVREVIGTRAPDLPEHEQRIGRSLAGWHETESGIARIYAQEGNPDDRAFALWVLQAQLKAAGFKIAQYDIELDRDDEALIKEATWDDVEAKAKRLVQTGKVQILRNGYNNIVAQVQGDHGSYQVEIGRDDPNSQSITTWQCECPWDQFAWNRTRQWKKYEGRVCAHCLAAFWAARSTPIDEEYSPAAQGVSPFGTPNPAGQTPGMAPGTAPPITPGRTFMPDNSQPQPTGQPQDLIPPYPMDPTMMPQVNPVSVPGLKPQTPLNPVQYGGGTFSSVQGWQFSPDPDTIWVVAGPTGFENGAMVSTKQDEVGTWIGKSEAHGSGSYTTIPRGSVGEVLGQDPTGLVNVLFMNKALGVQNFGELMPYGATAWFWPSDLVQRSDVKPPGPAVRRR